MTRDRRLLLLLGLLMAYGLFVAECRYHQHEDAATTETRHRHRHKHDSSSSRRSHHEIDRRGGWQEAEDYEYDAEPSPIDEDDYDAQSYHNHPRSHHRSAPRSYHSPTFEPRYARYHARGWYDEDNNDRRRIQPSRYNAKNHRYRGRSYYRPAYSSNREVSDYDDDTSQKDYKRHRYENGGTRNNFRRHNSGRDWRNVMTSGYRGARKHRLEVVNRDPWNSDWRRRSNSSESKYHFSKSDDAESEEDEDYEDHGGLEEDDREDEDELWKDIEDEDNDEDEDDIDDDNDFYKSETKPPLKTYDDIIRRLTSDDPTTPRSTVKRDYRNLEKYARRDGSRNHKPLNNSRTRPADFSKFTSAHPQSNYFANKQTAEENSTVKFNGAIERKSHVKTIGLVKGNDRQEAKNTSKINDAKTGSPPEQDYDEYLNTSDNEKEDDLVKAGVVDDTDMQADVTNTDYTDDDNNDESETLADILATSTRAMTKPVVQHYDYKDPKSYDSGTGAQYNGYQAKNEYPPMSAHSVHKWQLLGTRESVKEARSNMQLHKNNNKSDDIKEAVEHAVKVHKEGNCQWPRARLIPVREVYPNPSANYVPHCAILHRCSDDTGCCRSDTLTCVPKHSQRVELSFFTSNMAGSSVVEKLSFYNHTECECRTKPNENNATNEKGLPDQRVSRHHHHSLSSPPENMKKPKKPCRCPSQFTPRITQGVCQCHCFDNNYNCVKTRRGKAYLSLTDRMCIQRNECAMPYCEFGDYIHLQGKCPRKATSLDPMTTSYRTTVQHRPRS